MHKSEARSAKQGRHAHAKNEKKLLSDESTDGSEGALALQPQDQIVIKGKVVAQDHGQRRQAVQDPARELMHTIPPIAGQGPGIAAQAQAATQAQPLAAVGAVETSGTTKPLNATQALLQRQQAQKNKTAAAEPMRRQSPIQLTQEDRHSILESVSFALGEGKGEAMLLLNPKELGSLSIQLSMQGNQLSLRLSAERPEVAEALLEDMEKLKDMLQEMGLNIQDFDVRTGQHQDHRQEALDFRRSRGITSARRNENGTADAETGSAPTRPKSVLIDGTGIDFIA